MKKALRTESLAIHAGRRVDPGTGAVVAPVYLNTTFERAADGSYPTGYEYIRDGHPNTVALESTLASLEQGSDAVVFSSGSAAIMAVLFCCGQRHIVAGYDCYNGTLRQLREIAPQWGAQVDFVDTTNPEAVAAAVNDDTGLVWIETPSNPLMRITDIETIATLARDHGAVLAVDNTFSTPVLQQPMQHGADLSVHSTTKFIGGHSDVCGGAVIGRDQALLDRIRHYHARGGAVASAFDCWLLQRSIATLPLRVRQHCDNALTIARWLSKHPRVARVSYPGLEEHPGHDIARKQMHAGGGVLSFEIDGDRDAAIAVAGAVELITRATSLGGVESLIEHRASAEGPGSVAPDNLLRLSVGLEHSSDIIADLGQALDT